MHKSKLLLAAVLSALHMPAYAQVPPPRSDPLPLVQLAIMLAPELRNMCIARFPDLKASIEQQYSKWPLKDVKIQILVNGREYVSPTIQDFLDRLRVDFQTEPEARARGDCEKIGEILATFTKMPDEVFRQFVPPAKP